MLNDDLKPYSLGSEKKEILITHNNKTQAQNILKLDVKKGICIILLIDLSLLKG